MDSSSSLTRNHEKCEYQVFISFHGQDVRWGFLSHLIRALKFKQIKAFDDTQLKRTKGFEPELLRIIEQSDLSIVIFSQNYPISEYCMIELEKIHESMELRKHRAFPVFHKVDTSVVQNREGNYNVEKEQRREALKNISCISGADYKIYKDEAELVEYIVENVFGTLVELCPNISHGEGLFGISSRIKDVEDKLRIDSMNTVRVVGILGMGGIGKTTISDNVFHRNKKNFQGHCFVSDVRDTLTRIGQESLRKKIICELLSDENLNIGSSHSVDNSILIRIKRLKVLLVLDDVHDSLQLESLLEKCGLNSRDSFCPGSRIIVTSRDRQVLKDLAFGSHDIYEAQELNDNEALKLLCWGAFRQHNPPEEYEYLATKVVKYAHGIPMALVVLGSHLKHKEPSQWEDALKKFNTCSHTEIQKVFRASYDELDRNEKKIFLDIACFLKGEKKVCVVNVLEAFGFHARDGINRLIDKSLVKEEKEDEGVIITMHDLLEQTGQEIVAEEQDRERHQSRLWTFEDVSEALTNNTGTENVEVMSVERWLWDPLEIKPEAFTNMWKLRYLRFRFNHVGLRVNCPEGLEFLPNRIKFLHWDKFSQTNWPSNYNSEKLVELHLEGSKLEKITWTKTHKYLKVFSLRGSRNLTKIPDWKLMPNLEVVDLGYCERLVEIGSSLGELYKLKQFNVESCEKLSHVPALPYSIEEMELRGSGLSQLPVTDGHLYQLKRLSLSLCRQLENLPTSISGMRSLEVIDLTECSSLVEIKSSLENLKNLTRLEVIGCKRLSLLPELPSSILELESLGSGLKELPSKIGHLTRLKKLSFSACKKLKSLPASICNLTSLEKLGFDYCRSLRRLPEDLGNMKSLKELCATYSGLTKLPKSIRNLSKLSKLDLTGSDQIKSVPTLPSKIELVYARHCKSLCNKAKSSIVEQYRPRVHEEPTKIRRFFIDGRQLPNWMIYRNQSGTSISLKLQTFRRPIDIIFGVVASSNLKMSCIKPVAILTLQKSGTYLSNAYPDVAPLIHNKGEENQSYLFMWNCSIDCQFLKEVSFKLEHDSDKEKIIECGAHPILKKKKKKKKNRSKTENIQDKKHLNVDYNLASLFIEE